MRGGYYIRPGAVRFGYRALFHVGTGEYAAEVGRRLDFWKPTGMALSKWRGHDRPRGTRRA